MSISVAANVKQFPRLAATAGRHVAEVQKAHEVQKAYEVIGRSRRLRLHVEGLLAEKMKTQNQHSYCPRS
jgi:hypothetical protein